MKSGIQTTYGKAFEYACVKELYGVLSGQEEVVIVDSPQMNTAQSLYNSLSEEMVEALDKAAIAAVRVILQLEPQFMEF